MKELTKIVFYILAESLCIGFISLLSCFFQVYCDLDVLLILKAQPHSQK